MGGAWEARMRGVVVDNGEAVVMGVRSQGWGCIGEYFPE